MASDLKRPKFIGSPPPSAPKTPTPKETIGKIGGCQPRCFPKAPFRDLGKTSVEHFFSKFVGESSVDKSGLKPPVPVLSFDLGGLGASSQWIFGIWALCNFYITCFYILYYIRNFYVDLHCWASVPGCLHTEGTLT